VEEEVVVEDVYWFEEERIGLVVEEEDIGIEVAVEAELSGRSEEVEVESADSWELKEMEATDWSDEGILEDIFSKRDTDDGCWEYKFVDLYKAQETLFLIFL
jgi:hypothetical protein